MRRPRARAAASPDEPSEPRQVSRGFRVFLQGSMAMRAHFLFFAVLALGACKNGDRKGEVNVARSDSWQPARVAEIYFSTEVDGYMEPCGCTTKPLGGVQRLASVIDHGRADRVLIDAGNLLF